VGWRAASLRGAPIELADVFLAGLLLMFRRPLWRWMLRHLRRDDELQPQHNHSFWTP